jgi:hypothetical protein
MALTGWGRTEFLKTSTLLSSSRKIRRKQRGEGRMKDDRKAGRRRQNERRRQNGRWNREEKAEWRMTGKQGGKCRMEDERKTERRKQNGGWQ